MKISLLGYMGAGKSTLAKELSLTLQLPFIDLDARIAEKQGESVSEIILNRGELFFRQLERDLLEEALEQPNFVLSLGGGTPCYYDNMSLINSKSLSIYIEKSIGDLYEVLKEDRRERPLIAHLDDKDLKEFIAKHLFERRDFYERGILKVPQKQKTKAEALKTITDYLK